MKTGNRFERGSGVYKCGSCGRGTRSTGHGDNEHLRLCVQCFELAGMENELTDTGSTHAPTVRGYFAELAEKGIDAPALFPSLSDFLSSTTGVTEMKTDVTLANAFRVKKNADRAAGKKPPVAKIKAAAKAAAVEMNKELGIDLTKLTPAQRVAKIQADAEKEAAAKAAKAPVTTTAATKAAEKTARLVEQDKVLAAKKAEKPAKAAKVAKAEKAPSASMARRTLRRALRKAAKTAAADALKGVTAVGMDMNKLIGLATRAAVAASKAIQEAVAASSAKSAKAKA
jgi:hypothetical protein